ncbi:MAG: saccharopine dehydrogenase C-terminal domain-containing protein, partial [Candidatus Krumholzibacteria bacterium]|nr:saccharopine dehydrogenase C-terminal domain-containing protein [Candidatus Krumholzibacteria bacterium]
MNVLVLGAGLQGSAAAWDLANSPGVESVLLVDRTREILNRALQSLPPSRLDIGTSPADLSDPKTLKELLSSVDACLNALPWFMTLAVAEACARRGVHYVDLGGNTDIVQKILKLDSLARENSACLVPDCGLAPGMAATVTMAAIEDMDQVEQVKIRVGGLPQDPRPPLDYALFFSIHGLVNEYLGEAVQLRDGKIHLQTTLDDVESLEFPEPVGLCEAFSTLGGASTLPWTLQGRVRNLDYKTLRYPGHADKIRMLRDLGFFSETPEEGDAGSPREFTSRILEKYLTSFEAKDLILFRVDAEGKQGQRNIHRRFEMMDFFNEEQGMSAMRRTTAFPASIVLQM